MPKAHALILMLSCIPVAAYPQTSTALLIPSPFEGAESAFSTQERAEQHYAAVTIARETPARGFQWRPALSESFKLLAIQQGIMFSTDEWTRYNVSHGQFFNDWFRAVGGTFETWDDGDPWIDNYVGHPIQGAITGYIQVQNDARGRREEIGWRRSYWISRMKATAWSAAYSTQFEIGPISEASIANLGAYRYRNCPTCELTRGAGWVDLVVTPAGGLGWMLMEDSLDRFVVKRSERDRRPGAWSNFLRCALNPGRSAANMLAGKKPWYRARDESVQSPLVAIPRNLEAEQVAEHPRGREH
jgi:hypothetical protein